MADGLGTAAVLGQILGKSIKRLVISPLGDKEQALLLQIVHHRDVFMAFAQDGLVDTDVAHAAHVKKGFSIEIHNSTQRVSQVIENAAVSAILTHSPRTGAESQVPCRTALSPINQISHSSKKFINPKSDRHEMTNKYNEDELLVLCGRTRPVCQSRNLGVNTASVRSPFIPFCIQ